MAHVLVVEPDDLRRTLLRTLLAERGAHDVRAVASGEEALAALAADPRPWVAVLDLDGALDAELLLERAAAPGLPRCGFVLVSDHVAVRVPPGLRPLCVALRASPLRLPNRPDLLLAAVAAAARSLPSRREPAAVLPDDGTRAAT